MILFSPDWLVIYPGLAPVLGGGALGASPSTGPKRLGPLGLAIHTMVYAVTMVLFGVQVVLMAFIARAYPAHLGLLTESRWVARVRAATGLEASVVLGALLFAAGLAGAGIALHVWRAASFGAPQPTEMPRVVVPRGSSPPSASR